MKIFYLLALGVVLCFSASGKASNTQILSYGGEQIDPAVLNKEKPVKSLDKDNEAEIKGELTFDLTLAFDLACSACGTDYYSTGNFYGTGNISHIGSVSSKTRACLTFILSSGNVTGVHIENQCASFIAPNGDEIFLINDPYDLYLDSSGSAVGTCNFYFAGGTGKYQNAKGSFTGYVENNMKGQFTVEVNGKLDY